MRMRFSDSDYPSPAGWTLQDTILKTFSLISPDSDSRPHFRIGDIILDEDATVNHAVTGNRRHLEADLPYGGSYSQRRSYSSNKVR